MASIKFWLVTLVLHPTDQANRQISATYLFPTYMSEKELMTV